MKPPIEPPPGCLEIPGFIVKVGTAAWLTGGEGEAVTYLVDVIEKACTCESFTCNKRGEQEPGRWEADKHLAAAMALHGYFLATLAAQEESAERMQSISKAGNCADW